MAAESTFVAVAKSLIEEELREQDLTIRQGAALLYEVTVNNYLQAMPEAQIRDPKRGDSAFQTDLCLFQRKTGEIWLPRVVLEFKTTITTHDVLTYSAKAAKHKQVYPYLRYGLVAESERTVPGRFFTHNEAMDFCLCLRDFSEMDSTTAFRRLLREELACSQLLERVAFNESASRLFRTKIVLDNERSGT